jgi:hypothetical protein
MNVKNGNLFMDGCTGWNLSDFSSAADETAPSKQDRKGNSFSYDFV